MRWRVKVANGLIWNQRDRGEEERGVVEIKIVTKH
jgi:hypothetical protein